MNEGQNVFNQNIYTNGEFTIMQKQIIFEGHMNSDFVQLTISRNIYKFNKIYYDRKKKFHAT